MEMNRFDLIMARVDAWAAENAEWFCRSYAADQVDRILSHPELRAWSDDQIVETAIWAAR
jgi:hypothetical protein